MKPFPPHPLRLDIHPGLSHLIPTPARLRPLPMEVQSLTWKSPNPPKNSCQSLSGLFSPLQQTDANFWGSLSEKYGHEITDALKKDAEKVGISLPK